MAGLRAAIEALDDPARSRSGMVEPELRTMISTAPLLVALNSMVDVGGEYLQRVVEQLSKRQPSSSRSASTIKSAGTGGERVAVEMSSFARPCS